MTDKAVPEQKETILVGKPSKVLRSYSTLTLLANILIAASTLGFSALSAFPNMGMTYIAGSVLIFSVIGFVGRFLKQDLEGTETEGPVGFKGLSIRFVRYVRKYLVHSYTSLKERLQRLFKRS